MPVQTRKQRKHVRACSPEKLTLHTRKRSRTEAGNQEDREEKIRQPLKLASSLKKLTNLGLTPIKELLMSSSIFYDLIKVKNKKESSAQLILTLSNFYNPSNQNFIFNDDIVFQFCVKEVATVLGIKNTGNDFKEPQKTKFPQFLFDLRNEYFNVVFNSKITASQIKTILMKMPVDDENQKLHFKQLTSYFLVEQFLLCSSNSKIPRSSYWNFVEDLKSFEEVNWAKAIYDHICTSLKEVKLKIGAPKQLCFKGVAPVLEAIIYERIKSLYAMKLDANFSVPPIQSYASQRNDVGCNLYRLTTDMIIPCPWCAIPSLSYVDVEEEDSIERQDSAIPSPSFMNVEEEDSREREDATTHEDAEEEDASLLLRKSKKMKPCPLCGHRSFSMNVVEEESRGCIREREDPTMNGDAEEGDASLDVEDEGSRGRTREHEDVEEEETSLLLRKSQKKHASVSSHDGLKSKECRTNEVSLEGEVQSLKGQLQQLGDDSDCQLPYVQEITKNFEVQREQTVEQSLAIQELEGSILVFCRVNPLLFDEVSNTKTKVVDFPSNADSIGRVIDIKQNGKKYSFTYDKVFTQEASQEDVFVETSKLVQSAFDGDKVCIFAYGQTGSGKTYTMIGEPKNADKKGLIPRIVERAFETKQNLESEGWKYDMRVSMLEIYNDNIHDLLTPKNMKKQYAITHDPNGNILVSDLTSENASTIKGVSILLERAIKRRSVGSTLMNAKSSRSNFVFILKISGVNESTDKKVEGILNLIDLAGSQRISNSGVTGVRLEENKAINNSLSSLRRVILALDKKHQHVPFRNSKLTYLLEPCLGRNSKILFFVNVSPAASSVAESLCSLRFAKDVNAIQIGVPRRRRYEKRVKLKS